MILVIDKMFTDAQLLEIRQSAIDGGFASWVPPTALIGSGKYEGMSFHGNQSIINRAITEAMGRPVFPHFSFFRILTEGTEKRYVHSDRNDGDFTAILYLSDHADNVSGTQFFRHKPTGRIEMPSLAEMNDSGELEAMSRDMVEGSDETWEPLDFVRGLYGRMLIFSAPLFHGRFPLQGIGTTPEDARMIFVSHYCT